MAKKASADSNINGEEFISPGKVIQIDPPNFKIAEFVVEGTTPFVQLRFSQKAKNQMREAQEAGNVDKKKVRAPKDFNQLYLDAMYQSQEGWRGINAMSFKRSMIEACRTTNMKMTLAKLGIFIHADGFDVDEGIGLVRITKGEPHSTTHTCRNANKMPDLRVRAMWDAGWQAVVRIEFDSDMFSLTGIANLLTRAGMQCGIGEGRASSTSSAGAGMGWGMFRILTQ